jgi:hypothetical protein
MDNAKYLVDLSISSKSVASNKDQCTYKIKQIEFWILLVILSHFSTPQLWIISSLGYPVNLYLIGEIHNNLSEKLVIIYY